MAGTTLLRPPLRHHSLPGGRLASLLVHLFSFEMAFTLFLYSNQIKLLLPPFPIDETVIFLGLSVLAAVPVLLREGIYMRGLPVLATGLLFFGWIFLSYSWTPSQVLAKRTVSYLATFTVWCIIAGALLIANRRERVVRFFVLQLLLALLLTAVGLKVYFTYGTFRTWEGWEGQGRVYLSWGYTISSGAAIAFAIAIYSRLASAKQIIGVTLFGIIAFFLLVGGGRGPLLGVALAALIPLFVGMPRDAGKRLALSQAQVMGLGLILIAVVYVLYLLSTGESGNTLNRFIKLMNQDASVIDGPDRLRYWPAAWRFWLEAPIFGNGVASFSVMFLNAEVAGTQPHNLILEILCEFGLVGMGLFILFIASAMRHAGLARLRSDPVLMCAMMLFATTFIAAMFSVDIAGNRRLFFFLGFLVMRPPDEPAAAEDEPEASDA